MTEACQGRRPRASTAQRQDRPSGRRAHANGARISGDGTRACFLFSATGKLLWDTLVGPGGVLGGIEWGTACDGHHIYAAVTNFGHAPYHPAKNGALDTSVTLTGGSFAALDPATGKILWQTGDPNAAWDNGAVSAAGGVVFAGSTDGTMYALNGDTGEIEWTFASGGSVLSGAAIAGGDVFWGSGYSRLSPFGLTGNNKLYKFSSS